MPRGEPQHIFYFGTYNNPKETPEEWLEILKDPQYAIQYFIFSLEKAPTTGTLHFQYFIKFYRGQRISFFKKIPGLSNQHWELPYDNATCEHYCRKPVDGCECKHCVEERKTPSHVSGPYSWGHWAIPGHNIYTQAFKKRTVDEAMSFLIQERPRDIAMNGKRIRENLELHIKSPSIWTAPEIKIFPKSDYDAPILDLTKSVILYGTPGSGKTGYAMSHFKNPLLVRHIDQLYNEFKPGYHDGLVFDEVGVSHWPVPSIISLYDMAYPTKVNVRYHVATIPATFPRIFTINELYNLIPYGKLTDEETGAIERRVVVHQITEKIFS